MSPSAQRQMRNNVQNDRSSDKLVDEAENEPRLPLKVPPGLHLESDPVPFKPRAQAADFVPGDNNLLVDLSNDVKTTTRWVMPPSTDIGQPLQPSRSSRTGIVRLGWIDPPSPPCAQDEIIERLQPDSDKPIQKRFTMRQQARRRQQQNKKGGNNSSGKAPKVELEKPEPLPLPKKKDNGKGKENANPINSNFNKRTAAGISSGSIKPKPIAAPPKAAPESLVVEKSDLHVNVEQLLRIVDLKDGCVLRVDVGLILMKSPDHKILRNSTFTVQSLQSKLRADSSITIETVFLPRLTTSTSDVQHVLDLMSGPLDGMTFYTFFLRDQDGRLHEVDVPIAALDCPQVKRSVELAELYVHYPIRVWDARVSVSTTSDDARALIDGSLADDSLDMEAVEQFLATLRTVDAAPAFKINVPSNSFTVERVLAKREYTRTTTLGRLVVTEVQELILESIDVPNANLQALCHPREAMIDAHSLWWEARVHIDDTSLVDAATVQNVLDCLVTQMDGVGYGSRGPCIRPDPDRQGRVEPEIPFW